MSFGIVVIPWFLGALFLYAALMNVLKRNPELNKSAGVSCSWLILTFIIWPLIWISVGIPAVGALL